MLLRSERMRLYSAISASKLAMLVGQLFLFEVDQLAEGHFQDGVGLHGR